MSHSRNIKFAAILILLLARTGVALVNPSLQPGDLFDRHTTVLSLKVEGIDDGAKTATLTVLTVFKGNFAPKSVTLTAVGEEMNEAFFKVLNKGTTVTAFIGKPRQPLAFDFYAGAEGRWQGGAISDTKTPEAWNWTRDYNQHELFGTFNGHPDRLAEMMADKAAGRAFFPALIFDQFKNDVVVGKFDQPLRGVAMYDVDGDGRSDLFGCSPGGDRLYLQTAPMVFTDVTKQYGLNSKSVSVNIADVDADGHADLLLDATIWKQSADHRFEKTVLLPAPDEKNFISSAFVDVNGDGFPDVLVSRRGKGLSLFMNPGTKGGDFVDATHSAGLDRAECGSAGMGYFMVGDWNNDAQPSIFYASDNGYLLTQKSPGVFSPATEPLTYDFTANGEPGWTGAGCFAPVWKSDRQDILFARDAAQGWVVNENGKPMDAVPYGNEVQMGTIDQLGIVAEDLNADGNVDLYVGSRSGKPDMYLMNRGYGSFMTPDRYRPQVFPGGAHRNGAWGIAAGDVDGDGVNDLLLGGTDGVLTLIPNDVLSTRKPREQPKSQEQVLEQTSIISVQVTGRVGVLGARVTITDDQGSVVGRRDIGSNIATGCRSPDTVNLAVREPGKYVLKVRYSDGHEQSWPVEVAASKHVQVNAARDAVTAARDAGK